MTGWEKRLKAVVGEVEEGTPDSELFYMRSEDTPLIAVSVLLYRCFGHNVVPADMGMVDDMLRSLEESVTQWEADRQEGDPKLTVATTNCLGARVAKEFADRLYKLNKRIQVLGDNE